MFYEEETTFAMGVPQQSPATCTSLLFIWCLKFHRDNCDTSPSFIHHCKTEVLLGTRDEDLGLIMRWGPSFKCCQPASFSLVT